MAEILHPTRENFDDMLSRNHLVLVDFWAAWCAPCRMAAPVIEQLANLYQGRVAVAKVNVDEQQELAVRFGIQSIPTILVFKNGALQAVVTQNGEEIPCQDAIFALGHSARDTFFTLYENGIAMEQKPFAMGVRIEHDQQMINESQYGSYAGKLPAEMCIRDRYRG